jgi:hypothetical protein
VARSIAHLPIFPQGTALGVTSVGPGRWILLGLGAAPFVERLDAVAGSPRIRSADATSSSHDVAATADAGAGGSSTQAARASARRDTEGAKGVTSARAILRERFVRDEISAADLEDGNAILRLRCGVANLACSPPKREGAGSSPAPFIGSSTAPLARDPPPKPAAQDHPEVHRRPPEPER